MRNKITNKNTNYHDQLQCYVLHCACARVCSCCALLSKWGINRITNIYL